MIIIEFNKYFQNRKHCLDSIKWRMREREISNFNETHRMPTGWWLHIQTINNELSKSEILRNESYSIFNTQCKSIGCNGALIIYRLHCINPCPKVWMNSLSKSNFIVEKANLIKLTRPNPEIGVLTLIFRSLIRKKAQNKFFFIFEWIFYHHHICIGEDK